MSTEVLTRKTPLGRLEVMNDFVIRKTNDNSNCLSQRVYSHVIEGFFNDKFKPGDRITEASLRDELNMSSSPIREALGRLCFDGWIQNDSKRRGGCTVVNFYDIRKARQLYLARRSIEIGACYGFAERASDSDKVELDKIVNELEASFNAKDYLAYQEKDMLFHQKIVCLGGGEALMKTHRSILLQWFVFSWFFCKSRPSLDLRVEASYPKASHRHLLDVLVMNQLDKVASMINDHIAFEVRKVFPLD